jgi:hypothetical protein
MQPGEEFLCHGNGSPDEILSICLAQENREIYPSTHSGKLVRTRCQAVFDNEHSLHLWKRHPCTSTVERQLTDWREQVTTWRDLRGLLYSHNDIVCLLIQSNCIELQPSISILIWVAWLFDHPVFYIYFFLIELVFTIKTDYSTYLCVSCCVSGKFTAFGSATA